jgi:HPt (histidine-containing phosphotransfer) domain-containing protein
MSGEDWESVPPFDVQELRASFNDAPEVLESIFDIFLEEAPERVEKIRRGLADEDTETVRAGAHSLANTTGTLQAERALRLARATEAAARDGDLPALHAHGRSLLGEVESILGQIRDIRS